nr:hypothetical protein [Tanacetum cinerariifolium]
MCQEAMGDTIAQTRFENVSKLSNDLLVARGNTVQSDEDRMKLNQLMELCTNLQSRVIDLEKTKTTQALKITSLKRRVKKLEKKQSSRTHKLKRLYKGRKIHDIDADEDISLVNDQDDAEMVDVNDLHGEDVFVEKKLLIKRLVLLTMFDRAFNRVNTFVDFKTELVEGSSKRAREKLTQESFKKQKLDDDKETIELKELMKIISDKEEVPINVIPLAVKSPKIVG